MIVLAESSESPTRMPKRAEGVNGFGGQAFRVAVVEPPRRGRDSLPQGSARERKASPPLCLQTGQFLPRGPLYDDFGEGTYLSNGRSLDGSGRMLRGPLYDDLGEGTHLSSGGSRDASVRPLAQLVTRGNRFRRYSSHLPPEASWVQRTPICRGGCAPAKR